MVAPIGAIHHSSERGVIDGDGAIGVEMGEHAIAFLTLLERIVRKHFRRRCPSARWVVLSIVIRRYSH